MPCHWCAAEIKGDRWDEGFRFPRSPKRFCCLPCLAAWIQADHPNQEGWFLREAASCAPTQGRMKGTTVRI